jgi:hypothetical protein
MLRITTKDDGVKPVPVKKALIDLQDVLTLLGVVLIETGLAKIHIPTALIVGGVLCLTPFALTAWRGN